MGAADTLESTTFLPEDVPHWDGGYMGNPALIPLYETATDDILLVQINPLQRRQTPRRCAKSTTGTTRSRSTALCCANCGRWRSFSN